MREVLFRGKHNDSGGWKYGDLLHATYSGETLYWIMEGKSGWGKTSYTVEPSTIGQFTGLCDHAGTKIFEGDILVSHDEEEGRADDVGIPIVYHDAGFCVQYPCKPTLYHALERRDCEYIEVIGNVHDTPELLMAGTQ